MQELRDKKVLVTTIFPGYVATEMTRSFLTAASNSFSADQTITLR